MAALVQRMANVDSNVRRLKTMRTPMRADSELRHYFVDWLKAAEMHWFFVQGVDALAAGLYLPGVLSLLNGVEATLRITLHQLRDFHFEEELDCHQVLSNALIRKGAEAGLPADKLAFPGETDFVAKLNSAGPSRRNVEIVRQRHNLCHGNVLEYVNRELGEQNQFFTPECLRDLSAILVVISQNWVRALGEFRKTRFSAEPGVGGSGILVEK